MQKVDIRPLKKRLREEIKEQRRGMSPEAKAAADAKILDRLCGMREYGACKTLLTYVSLPIEVDTLKLIERALLDGKRVAVPRCVPGTRQMEFYVITDMEDLMPQTYGVLEPKPEVCSLLDNYDQSICIVPALAYDRMGYRLGYGAGYYDRFLSGYPGRKIGLVYQEHLRRWLWHGRYDITVDLVLTQKQLVNCASYQQQKK